MNERLNFTCYVYSHYNLYFCVDTNHHKIDFSSNHLSLHILNSISQP